MSSSIRLARQLTRGQLVVRAMALLVVGLLGVPSRGEPGQPAVYERGWRSIESIARGVVHRAEEDGLTSLVWILGRGFRCPSAQARTPAEPKRLDRDVSAWLGAMERASGAGPNCFVASAVGGAPVSVGSPDWRKSFDVDGNVKRGATIPSASRRTSELLSQLPRGGAGLVWILDGHEPECVDLSGAPVVEGGALWWDPDDVTAVVKSKGARLWIVSPEARFGESAETDRLPFLPWASRPIRPKAEPTDPRTQAIIDELIRRERERMKAEGRQFTMEGDAEPVGPEIRFEYDVSEWRHVVGGRCVRGTDVPSGFGDWRYARTAALAGGTYVFYPTVGTDRFLDPCVFDPVRRDVVTADRPLTTLPRDGSVVGRWIRAATLRLAKVTPWARGSDQSRPSDAWFVATSVAREPTRSGARDLPMPWIDLPVESNAANRANLVRQLLATLREYDQVSQDAARAFRAFRGADGAATPWNPSLADLMTFRAQVEISAFHLQALVEALRATPEDETPTGAVTWIATVNITELIGMPGLAVLREQDHSPCPIPPELANCGYFGSPLLVDYDDPDFRASRSIDAIAAKFPPPLRDRLESVRDVAAESVEFNRETPWEWLVRYAGLYTFVLTDRSPEAAGAIPDSVLRGSPGGPPSTDPDPPPTPR